MGRDLTEEILEAVVNGLADELKNMRSGDPAHIRVAAKLKKARKDLDDYRKQRRRKR